MSIGFINLYRFNAIIWTICGALALGFYRGGLITPIIVMLEFLLAGWFWGLVFCIAEDSRRGKK